MVSRVLVPMDDSDVAERASRYALGANPDAEITVPHVVGEPSPAMGRAMRLAREDDIERAAEEHAEDLLAHAHDVAGEYDAEVDTDVTTGHPARAIVERAGTFDTVVIGSHGGPVADRSFVGDGAETVVRRSSAPVTVVR